MISQPLFGKDSSPHKTSFFLSVVITSVMWTAGMVTAFLVVPSKKNTFSKPVQIVLDSPEDEIEEEIVDLEEPEKIEELVEEIIEEIVEQPPLENFTEPVSEPDYQPESVPVVEEPAVVETIPEPALPPPAPVVETPKVEPAPVVEPPKVEVKPAPVIETPKPAPKPEPKQEVPPKKTEPAPVKTEPKVVDKSAEPEKPLYEIQKSVDDLMNEQLNKKKNYDDYDWDNFDDTKAKTNENTVKTEKVTTQSTSVGSSASVDKNTVSTGATSQTTEKKETVTVSEATSSALSSIENVTLKTYTKSSGNNKSSSTMNSKASVDGIQIQMEGGKLRTLMEPLTTAIPISEFAAETLQGDREVTITFSVIPNGNVPADGIKISPESILTPEIIDDIKKTMTTWRFERSDAVSTCSFKFTIIKK